MIVFEEVRSVTRRLNLSAYLGAAVVVFGISLAAPTPAHADCGMWTYADGYYDADDVVGWTESELTYECLGWNYTGDVYVSVSVEGPGGSDLDQGEGFLGAYAETSVPKEAGTYEVSGVGYAPNYFTGMDILCVHPIVLVQVPCAVPTNFHQISSENIGGGTLKFVYNWESSTGETSDLAACEVGEYVTYDPADIPFPPPFPALVPQNPTDPSVPGGLGQMGDEHSTPGAFREPYFQNTIIAEQIYRYRCPCANGGNWVTLLGPHNIERHVEPSGLGGWRFRITKTGSSALIEPLP